MQGEVPAGYDVERLDAVCRKYGISVLLVFGSVARGEATPSSDVDLLYDLRGEALLDHVEPEIRSLDAEPALKADYERWSSARAAFNGALAARDPEAVAQGWQRGYVRGDGPVGFHRTSGGCGRPELQFS